MTQPACDPRDAALEQIARMKIFPDDRINRYTLLTAIRLAQQVVNAKPAREAASDA